MKWPDILGQHAFGRFQLPQVIKRIEHRMPNPAFAVAVSQEVIVTIDQTDFHDRVVGQIRMTPAVQEFIEQPMRGPVLIASTAIGIECGRKRAIRYRRRYVGIGSAMPRLMEIPVGRVPKALPEIQVEIQQRPVRPVFQQRLDVRVTPAVPWRVEHGPDDRGFVWQPQCFPNR